MCSCGKAYDVDHALSCAKGGFSHLLLDHVRDLFSKTMSEVHKDVATELALMSLTREHLHVSARQRTQPMMHVSMLESDGFGKMVKEHFSI